jgi:hypothetical protein
MNDKDDYKEVEEKIIADIRNKKYELEINLKKIDKSIYDIETKYFETTKNCGNIVKGWEQFFTVKPKVSSGLAIKRPKLHFSERIFSQSSFINNLLREDISNNIQNIRKDNNSEIINNSIRIDEFIRDRPKKKMVCLKKKKSNDYIIHGRLLNEINKNSTKESSSNIPLM